MHRGLRASPRGGREIFRTYAWDVEMNYTVSAKGEGFNWGLLRGKLEAQP